MHVNPSVRPTPGSLKKIAWKKLGSRVFIVSILVYFVVAVYLIVEAINSADKWEPYGVSIPLFITLLILSEVVITITGVWIFKEDRRIWPEQVFRSLAEIKRGPRLKGVVDLTISAWDVSILDLRLRTNKAVWLGRINRLAALAPLIYTIGFSAGKAPWGLIGTASIDVIITLIIWLFMELVMVKHGKDQTSASPTLPRGAAGG